MTAVPLPPGERLSSGPASEPRPASTIVLLRDGTRGLEVLLVQRNPRARFMGGMWVFPGGAVDRHDGTGEDAHRRAGMREVHEEVGVTLPGPDALVPVSRWVTPERLAVRFDTLFYLARMPDGQEAVVDGSECVQAAWPTPAEALEAHAAGRMPMVLPTVSHLRRLSGAASVAEALGDAESAVVETFRPRVVGDGEDAHVEITDS